MVNLCQWLGLTENNISYIIQKGDGHHQVIRQEMLWIDLIWYFNDQIDFVIWI